MKSLSMKFLDIFGYIVSIIVLLVGVGIIFGLLLSENVPSNYRTLLGVVFILYGTYRFITLRIKQKRDFSDNDKN